MLSADEQSHAALVRARLAKRMQQIEANQDLTARARDRERAKAIAGARDEMRGIRQQSAERVDAESTLAYMTAFGIYPDHAGEDRQYRESLAARSPGPEETEQLYGQARARGDLIAQTAIAEYAWTRRHDPLSGQAFVNGVLQPYGESAPEYDAAIMTMINAENPDRIAQLRDKLLTEIQQPADLKGDLNRLAADDSGTDSADSA